MNRKNLRKIKEKLTREKRKIQALIGEVDEAITIQEDGGVSPSKMAQIEEKRQEHIAARAATDVVVSAVDELPIEE